LKRRGEPSGKGGEHANLLKGAAWDKGSVGGGWPQNRGEQRFILNGTGLLGAKTERFQSPGTGVT